MWYFILFLVCVATWIAAVIFVPKIFEQVQKELKAKAEYAYRLANPPSCKDCAWAAEYDNPLMSSIPVDLTACKHPNNPNKFAETFRKGGCGTVAKYFEEKL